jgi:hypothetical protein
MLIAIVPVVVLILGLLIWALAANPVPKEAGRLMFFAGMFIAVWISARATVHLP